MRLVPFLAVLLALAGCAVPVPPDPAAIVAAGPRAEADIAARAFIDVVNRVEPVAEQVCRERTSEVDCDLQIYVDNRRGQPRNAFQTIDPQGRPAVIFTTALIADARNTDELAFIMGHEAAHHIAGHIPRAKINAELGALVLGSLAEAAGQSRRAVDQAAQIGAQVGARQFARDFELEADALGTVIAFRAGYDPVRGAQFFARIPDPGDQFLGTHPPNAERQQVVEQTAARLR